MWFKYNSDLQRRYPDLNVTEEDIKNAEEELEKWNKEMDEKLKGNKNISNEKDTETTEPPPAVEEKKTI